MVVRFAPGTTIAALLTDPRDQTVPLPRSFGTYGYTAPLAPPIATFDDGTAAITQREFSSGGSAYALGLDLGALLLIGYNNRDESMARSYVNDYEPALDVYLRMLRTIYQRGEPDAVTLDPVPHGRALSVLFTHDVDYRHSLANAIEYARLERAWGIRATYFIQTKYVRDWNDTAFFDATAVRHLRTLDSLDMEIASHSVAHAGAFNRISLGSGHEVYPSYWPRVTGAKTVDNATILGEVRVSKFLLEHFSGTTVESFRPGHLRNPPVLPQALEAAGYRYSSSVTANNSLTHLPFQLNYDRGPEGETRMFEFPVTVEDEAPPAMDRRLPEALALADRLAAYGGVCVVLIHPNVLGPKLEFERGFYAALKARAWFGSMGEFGRFWAARNGASVDVKREGAQRTVTLVLPTRIDGLTLSVPRTWRLTRSSPASVGAVARGGRVTLTSAEQTVQLVFHGEN